MDSLRIYDLMKIEKALREYAKRHDCLDPALCCLNEEFTVEKMMQYIVSKEMPING